VSNDPRLLIASLALLGLVNSRVRRGNWYCPGFCARRPACL